RGDDEIGRLIDGFNDMLTQIQARDAELEASRDTLENKVEERTQSLLQLRQEAETEKARFKFIFDSVPVGISLYSRMHDHPETSCLINEAHLRICGISHEQA